MKEQNRDNLELFFRDGAQNHNLEFNEADWQKLEQQLDREMPVVVPWWQFLKKYGIGLLAILLLTSGWFAYNIFSGSTQEQAVQTDLQQTITAQKIQEKPLEGLEALSNESEDKTTFKSSEGKTIEQQVGQEAATRSTGETIENDNRPQANASGSDENELVAMAGAGPEQTALDKNTISGQVVFEEGADAGGHIIGRQLLVLAPIRPDYVIVPAGVDVDFYKGNKVLPEPGRPVYFKVGIGYSPDFSTVGIGNFVAPGSRWKIMGEMGFLKRFVLGTGVVLVDNKYEALGEDYHAPPRYWRKGIVADEAYGECKMIDIPVNIRYNFIQRSRHSFFASAGASTYFVTKEDYFFSYDQNDPDLPGHWGTDKTTVYPFGIINFSLGYELNFGRRSGLQIEPFIKIPTTGIGWGNVDLHTMGVYLMYKYTL